MYAIIDTLISKLSTPASVIAYILFFLILIMSLLEIILPVIFPSASHRIRMDNPLMTGVWCFLVAGLVDALGAYLVEMEFANSTQVTTTISLGVVAIGTIINFFRTSLNLKFLLNFLLLEMFSIAVGVIIYLLASLFFALVTMICVMFVVIGVIIFIKVIE